MEGTTKKKKKVFGKVGSKQSTKNVRVRVDPCSSYEKYRLNVRQGRLVT